MSQVEKTPERSDTTSTQSRGSEPNTGSASSGHASQLKASLVGHDYASQVQMLAPDGPNDGSIHAAAAQGLSGGGGKLPHGEQIQQSFGGYDISNVQAHTGSAADQATGAMGANAYATGNNVVLGQKGQDLHTTAHEAAHVVQQRAGVSLSGGVGKSGDGYEKHADKVVDLVVQGKFAEGLLGEMGGGVGAGAVQQKAVQRVAAPHSAQGVSSAEASVVDARATSRGVGLESQGQFDRNGGLTGTATVNRDGGTSMAENPEFEKDALAFESALAAKAAADGNGPASVMAKQARTYLLEKVGGRAWTTATAALEAELKKIGSVNPRWSGSVGLEFQALLDALDTGSCSVKMMHLDNFYSSILLPDVKADIPAVETLISGIRDIEAREKAEEQAALAKSAGPNAAAYAIPAGSEVEGQGETRAYRYKEDKRTTKNTSRKVPTTDKTVGDVGIPLDPNELKVQAEASGETASASMKLQWEEGAEKWALNEKNKWVFLMRQLSLPLMAGPSGTTNKLMNMGTIFGSSPVQTRLAAMGYLMPPNHHSLVEILAAAAGHGASFIAGRRMYNNILPYNPGQLKAMGGGKFPHETHGDKAVVGDNVVDVASTP